VGQRVGKEPNRKKRTKKKYPRAQALKGKKKKSRARRGGLTKTHQKSGLTKKKGREGLKGVAGSEVLQDKSAHRKKKAKGQRLKTS